MRTRRNRGKEKKRNSDKHNSKQKAKDIWRWETKMRHLSATRPT